MVKKLWALIDYLSVWTREVFGNVLSGLEIRGIGGDKGAGFEGGGRGFISEWLIETKSLISEVEKVAHFCGGVLTLKF